MSMKKGLIASTLLLAGMAAMNEPMPARIERGTRQKPPLTSTQAKKRKKNKAAKRSRKINRRKT